MHYICPKCQKKCAPTEARDANYRCDDDRAFLVSRGKTPPARAVLSSDVMAPEPEPPPPPKKPTLADILAAAVDRPAAPRAQPRDSQQQPAADAITDEDAPAIYRAVAGVNTDDDLEADAEGSGEQIVAQSERVAQGTSTAIKLREAMPAQDEPPGLALAADRIAQLETPPGVKPVESHGGAARTAMPAQDKPPTPALIADRAAQIETPSGLERGESHDGAARSAMPAQDKPPAPALAADHIAQIATPSGVERVESHGGAARSAMPAQDKPPALALVADRIAQIETPPGVVSRPAPTPPTDDDSDVDVFAKVNSADGIARPLAAVPPTWRNDDGGNGGGAEIGSNGNGNAHAAAHRPKPANGSDIVAAVVLPPQQNFKDAAAMEQLAGTLARLLTPVSMEIAGESAQRRIILRGTGDTIDQVTAQLQAVYGQIEIDLLEPQDDPAEIMAGGGDGVVMGAALCAAKPPFLPFKTWREFQDNDPLVALLGAFSNLEPGEMALSQVVVRGAADSRWADGYLEQLVHLKRRGFGGEGPMPTGTIVRNGVVPMIGFVLLLMVFMWAIGDWQRMFIAAPAALILVVLMSVVGGARNYWTGAMEEDAAAKLREQALQVEIRLFAKAETRARALTVLNRLISAYSLFNTTSGNQFAVKAARSPDPGDLRCAQKAGLRRLGLGRGSGAEEGLLLNVKELAGLWHMPVGEALDLVKRQTWERMLPDRMAAVSDENGALIGASRKGGKELPIFLPAEALKRNIFVIGKTQHGKTTFMEHVVARWMADTERAVLIVDPHGDLARRAIGLVPPERVKDVIYIDLSDAVRTVAINLLDMEGGMTVDQVVENVVNVGRSLWKDYWGPRMVVPLIFALRALTIANRHRHPWMQYTILSLIDLLTCDTRPRDSFLKYEVPEIEAPDVFKYFKNEYRDSSASHREQVIAPVLSKAHAFERSAIIRHLVGQPRSTVHLFEAIRGRKIVILNNNSGALGEDMAGFIGSLFLNVMRLVITRQTELPREDRVQVAVCVDEFQIHAAGFDFGAAMGELAKNGGNFLIGTQSLDNLRAIEETGALRGKIFAGATTTVVFQCNGEDARYLVETELDHKRLAPESLINIPPHHAYVKTIGPDRQRLPVFSLRMSPPRSIDGDVAAAVLAGRDAYTLPRDVAERYTNESIRRFTIEHVEVPDSVRLAREELKTAEDERRAREAALAASCETATETGAVPVGAQAASPNPNQRQRVLGRERVKFKPPAGLDEVEDHAAMFANAMTLVAPKEK